MCVHNDMDISDNYFEFYLSDKLVNITECLWAKDAGSSFN